MYSSVSPLIPSPRPYTDRAPCVLEGRKGKAKQVIFVRVWKYFLIFKGLINNLPTTRGPGENRGGQGMLTRPAVLKAADG